MWWLKFCSSLYSIQLLRLEPYLKFLEVPSREFSSEALVKLNNFATSDPLLICDGTNFAAHCTPFSYYTWNTWSLKFIIDKVNSVHCVAMWTELVGDNVIWLVRVLLVTANFLYKSLPAIPGSIFLFSQHLNFSQCYHKLFVNDCQLFRYCRLESCWYRLSNFSVVQLQSFHRMP
jgi:hypothetical protein